MYLDISVREAPGFLERFLLLRVVKTDTLHVFLVDLGADGSRLFVGSMGKLRESSQSAHEPLSWLLSHPVYPWGPQQAQRRPSTSHNHQNDSKINAKMIPEGAKTSPKVSKPRVSKPQNYAKTQHFRAIILEIILEMHSPWDNTVFPTQTSEIREDL